MLTRSSNLASFVSSVSSSDPIALINSTIYGGLVGSGRIAKRLSYIIGKCLMSSF